MTKRVDWQERLWGAKRVSQTTPMPGGGLGYDQAGAWWHMRTEAKRAYAAWRAGRDGVMTRYWWLQEQGQTQGSFAIPAQHYIAHAFTLLPEVVKMAADRFFANAEKGRA